MQKYYTTQELAELYHTTAKNVAGWCRCDVFPHAMKFSKKNGWIIPESDIMQDDKYLRDPKEFIKKKKI